MVCGLAVSAQADLIPVGGGMIYDSDLDITWLQDANYAGSIMDPGSAVAWADALEYQGYTDWRLPSSLEQNGSDPVEGYNADSEMGHLYYVTLGNSAGGPLVNSGPFTNLGPFGAEDPSAWWSETIGPPPWSLHCAFDFATGYQMTSPGLLGGGYAWAVRDGYSTPIPEPATMLMVGGLCAGLAGAKKLRRKK
jgi:hypothetical protein